MMVTLESQTPATDGSLRPRDFHVGSIKRALGAIELFPEGEGQDESVLQSGIETPIAEKPKDPRPVGIIIAQSHITVTDESVADYGAITDGKLTSVNGEEPPKPPPAKKVTLAKPFKGENELQERLL